MSSLAGKVAICTGSGRKKGLGAAVLLKLAAEGCKIVVTDIGAPSDMLDDVGVSEGMEEVAQLVREAGAECITVPCDVRSAESVDNLMQAAMDAFGRIDILVNNAGIGYMMEDFMEVTPEAWRVVLDVNLTGAFLCTQAAAKHMIAGGEGGRIINIASQAAKSGFPHLAAYVASKHGMVGLTRSNAIELGKHGITVNAVCPNHVTTDLGAKQNAYYAKLQGKTLEEFMQAMRDKIPLGRPGLPEDTANAVAFLSTDEAQYITGEALNVSGGEEMH